MGEPIDITNPVTPFDPTYLNIAYLFNRLLEFFRNLGAGDLPEIGFALAWYLKVFLAIASLAAVVVIIWYLIKLYEVRAQYDVKYGFVAPVEAEDQRKNERWEHVEQLIASQNPNDWRQAIIEADTMLDDVVKRMGLPGETLGERLQAVEPSDFLTLDSAWEAHKVRNRIAHEGSAFALTDRDARYTIKLYERVFREFGYI